MTRKILILCFFAAFLMASCSLKEETRRTANREAIVNNDNNESSKNVGLDKESGHSVSMNNDDFAWLATSRISKADLEARGYRKADYRILRNAIFARHGYVFKSADLIEYFSQFSWYNPQYSDVTSRLSSIEKANIATLKKLENGIEAASPSKVSSQEDGNPFLWLSQRKYENYEFYDMGVDRETLRIWRNAIYARHGYIFKSKDLAAYFSRYSWYVPRYKVVDSRLSAIEAHNIKVLKQMYDNY